MYKTGLVMVITSPSSVVFALRLSRHLPRKGEGFWLAASNQAVSRASAGFSLGWRSCQQARRAQMTDEGGRDTNLLGKVIFFPLIRLFSLRSKSHLLHRRGEGFWYFASHQAMRCACVPSPMRGRWRGAPDEVVEVNDRSPSPGTVALLRSVGFSPPVEKLSRSGTAASD